MVEVKEIIEPDIWNKQLKKCINGNVFSTYEWGEYKKSSWGLLRIAFYNSGNFLGQTQILIKSKIGITIGWCSGGINVVDYSKISEIYKLLKEYFKKKNYIIRFNFFDCHSGKLIFELNQYFNKANKIINSGFTIKHYLEENVEVSFSSKHRYYVKKAYKDDFQIKFGGDLMDDFLSIHNQMVENKKLNNLSLNRTDLLRLHEVFKNKLMISVVYKNSSPVAGSLVLINEESSIYYLAASNDAGRKTYASYFMINELISHLKSIGIKMFDFGGITPYKENAAGVNKFKLGFGGEIINYIGEWEICSNKLLRLLFNMLISRIN